MYLWWLNIDRRARIILCASVAAIVILLILPASVSHFLGWSSLVIWLIICVAKTAMDISVNNMPDAAVWASGVTLWMILMCFLTYVIRMFIGLF
jgi:hypothetical protein